MPAVILLVVAGCVGATPSASPSASREVSHPATASAPPSPRATPTDTPTATPAATYDLSNLPTAPAGDWKSIRWMQVPATPAIALPSPEPSSGLDAGPGTVYVAGWSHGFVGFTVQIVYKGDAGGFYPGGPTTANVATTHSSDGVHWKNGTVITQQIKIDDLYVTGLFEGPSGLLAVGESVACATGWVEALWTSPDGASWQKVDTKKAFGNATILNVSGGSSGFVATDATGNHVWTSRDGQSWSSVNLDALTFANSRIDGGTAFSGGFVLAGSTAALGAWSCGVQIADPSATPTPAPPMRSPAVWWSANGGTWTKSELPGATPAQSVAMSICRANDQTLLAFEYYNTNQNSGSGLWTSKDGRTWKSLVWPSGIRASEILTDGRHGVLVTDAGSISMVTHDGGLVTLAQEGDPPQFSSDIPWVLGPTGILVSNSDGTQLLIGLPS